MAKKKFVGSYGLEAEVKDGKLKLNKETGNKMVDRLEGTKAENKNGRLYLYADPNEWETAVLPGQIRTKKEYIHDNKQHYYSGIELKSSKGNDMRNDDKKKDKWGDDVWKGYVWRGLKKHQKSMETRNRLEEEFNKLKNSKRIK